MPKCALSSILSAPPLGEGLVLLLVDVFWELEASGAFVDMDSSDHLVHSLVTLLLSFAEHLVLSHGGVGEREGWGGEGMGWIEGAVGPMRRLLVSSGEAVRSAAR